MKPVPRIVALISRLANNTTQAKAARQVAMYRRARTTWKFDWENELEMFRRILRIMLKARHEPNPVK